METSPSQPLTLTEAATARRNLYIVFEAAMRLIDPFAVRAVDNRALLIAQDVVQRLLRHDDEPSASEIRRLVDHQRVHASFLVAVLELRSERCLVESLIWAYRTLLAQHFSPEFLRTMIQTWPEALRAVLSGRVDTRHFEALYEIIDTHHTTLIDLATMPEPELEVPGRFRAPFDAFCQALLDADAKEAETVVQDHISVAAQVPIWWEEVIAPALHRVGRLWALGEIDEAQEHIATAIAHRVMTRVYPRLPRLEIGRETVAVLVSPGEAHDIGATMVRDTLELGGYRVMFTGRDTPVDTAIPLLKNNDVRTLLVSTTVATNLTKTSTLIRDIRRHTEDLRVVVGGQAYQWDPGLWQTIGADAHEPTLRGALDLVEAASKS